jgi:hypothetical protein
MDNVPGRERTLALDCLTERRGVRARQRLCLIAVFALQSWSLRR